MTAIVVITATIKPEDRDAFEAAYLAVNEAVTGTPGHVRDVLMRDAADNGAYVLLAEWTSQELFLAWADDPDHIQQSAPMFPYWAETFERRIYELRAALHSHVPSAELETARVPLRPVGHSKRGDGNADG